LSKSPEEDAVAKVSVFINPDPRTPASAILEQARTADRQGFDSVWLGDHLIDYRGRHVPEGPFDSFTLMTAIGAQTKRIRLAWGMLNPSFRNPAVLAKMLATLDQITEGRVICSLGAGWLKPEYEAYDVPFVEDHDERIAHEREVVQLLKELWTRPAPDAVTFEGEYVRVRDLQFNPVPYQRPHPPILIGGDSEPTLALAHELGDGWVPLMRGQPEIVRELRADPSWPARPFSVVRLTRLIVGETADGFLPEAEEAYEIVRNTATLQPPPTFEEFLASEVIGTPEECLQRIDEMEQAGIDYHLVTFESQAQQERAARLLLPHLSRAAVPTAAE
jgi:alkanesulfonate monooxygenase SsuD/methylene tetrahydromethanopterin reductase-like flavin-dependent oxidoreductase (luciferase family)